MGENVKQLGATSHKSVEKTIDKMSSIPLWYYAFSFAPVIFMLGIMIGSIFFGCGINLSGKSFDGDSSRGIPDLINESSAATTAA